MNDDCKKIDKNCRQKVILISVSLLFLALPRRIHIIAELLMYLQRLMSYQSSSIQKQPPNVFCKKDVLKNLANITGKHLCQKLFFNKVAGKAFKTSNILLILNFAFLF